MSELGDEQRVTRRLFGDARGEGRRSFHRGGQELQGETFRVAIVERRDDDLGGRRQPERRIAEERVQERRDVGRSVAVAADEEKRDRLWTAESATEQHGALPIAPLQIVDPDDELATLADPAEQ